MQVHAGKPTPKGNSQVRLITCFCVVLEAHFKARDPTAYFYLRYTAQGNFVFSLCLLECTSHIRFGVTELVHSAMDNWMKWTHHLVICSKTGFCYSSQLQLEGSYFNHSSHVHHTEATCRSSKGFQKRQSCSHKRPSTDNNALLAIWSATRVYNGRAHN